MEGVHRYAAWRRVAASSGKASSQRCGAEVAPEGGPRRAGGLHLGRFRADRRQGVPVQGRAAGRPRARRRHRVPASHPGDSRTRSGGREVQLRQHGPGRRDARHRLQVGRQLVGARHPDQDDRLPPDRHRGSQEPPDRRQPPRRRVEQGQGRQRLLPRLPGLGLALRRQRLPQPAPLHVPVVGVRQRRNRQRLRLRPQPARRVGAEQPLRAEHGARPVRPPLGQLLGQLRRGGRRRAGQLDVVPDLVGVPARKRSSGPVRPARATPSSTTR